MSEAEAAIRLKRAMSTYSFNSISSSELGIFKGVEADGVTVKMKLEGDRLAIYPVETPTIASPLPIVKEPEPEKEQEKEPEKERTFPARRRRTPEDESSEGT